VWGARRGWGLGKERATQQRSRGLRTWPVQLVNPKLDVVLNIGIEDPARSPNFDNTT